MGYKLSVEIPDNAYQLVNNLRNISKSGLLADKELDRSFSLLMQQALAKARAVSPGGTHFKSLWHVFTYNEPDTREYVLRNLMDLNSKGKDVLIYMEYGTKPHKIEPKNARALRWFSDNIAIFAKSVFHPGTKPYLMFSQARELVLKSLNRLSDDITKRIRQNITSGM